MTIINRIRFAIIEMLAGDIPVVLNMNIVTPHGADVVIVQFPDSKKPGLFCNNRIYGDDAYTENPILTPCRDYDVKALN